MDIDSSPESPSIAPRGDRKRSRPASEPAALADNLNLPPQKRSRTAPAAAPNSNSSPPINEGALDSQIRSFLRVLAAIEETVRDAIAFAYEEGVAQGLKEASGASLACPTSDDLT